MPDRPRKIEFFSRVNADGGIPNRWWFLLFLASLSLALLGCLKSESFLGTKHAGPGYSSAQLIKNATYLKQTGWVGLAARNLEEAHLHLQDPENKKILDPEPEEQEFFSENQIQQAELSTPPLSPSLPPMVSDRAKIAIGDNTQNCSHPSDTRDSGIKSDFQRLWPTDIPQSETSAETTVPVRLASDVSLSPRSESNAKPSDNQVPGKPDWKPVKPTILRRLTDPKLDWFDRVGPGGTVAGKIDVSRFFSEDIKKRGEAMSIQRKFKTTYSISENIRSELTFLGMGCFPQRQFSSNMFERDIFNDLSFGNDVFYNPRSELIICDLRQKFNDFSFGMGYHSVGADLKNLDDIKKMVTTNVRPISGQQVAEFWVAKKFGPLSLKTFMARYWDNKLYDSYRDSKRYRMATNVTGISLDSKIPLTPLYMGVSYSQGYSKSIFSPRNKEPQSTFNQDFGGYLYYYGGKLFDVTVSTSYSPIKDQIHAENNTEVYWHEISANFRPSFYITITPTVALGDYRWPGNITKSQFASLSLNYSEIARNVDLWFWGSWSQTKGSAGYEDYKNLNAYLGISWQPSSMSRYNAKFTLEGGYDKYIDNIYPEYTCEGFSSFISFKLKN